MVWKGQLFNLARSWRWKAPLTWMLTVPPTVWASSSSTTISWWRRLFSSDASPTVCKTAEDVARYLQNRPSCQVVVMAGAGISTASGIPDFRTPGSGLYSNLEKYNLPYPEAVFDIDFFHQNPNPFYTLAKELYPWGGYRPNVVHYFVRLLFDKGLLLRMYTQNIDGLERLAGLPGEKLVEAHGTFATASCKTCLKSYDGSVIEEFLKRGEVAKCQRKLCPGVIKPDIVFFGEMLPKRFYMFLKDMPQADLLIILGTSLEVEPFASIAGAVLPGTPRILFNMQAAGPFRYHPRESDVVVEGDLVEKIWMFSELLGWKEELKNLIADSETIAGDRPPVG